MKKIFLFLFLSLVCSIALADKPMKHPNSPHQHPLSQIPFYVYPTYPVFPQMYFPILPNYPNRTTIIVPGYSGIYIQVQPRVYTYRFIK
jgi:hypothetical protein